MAETYRGHIITEALTDQYAVYDRGAFRGHHPNIEAARAFVDRQIVEINHG